MHECRLSFCVTAWLSMVLHLSMWGVVSGQTEEATLHTLSQPESVEVLSMISRQIRGNSEKIHTWQGQVEFVFDNYSRGEQAVSLVEQRALHKSKETGIPREVRRRKSGTITFILDKSKKSHYERVTRSQPIRYYDTNESEVGTESGPYEAVSIITPESYTHSVAVMSEGHPTGHWTEIEPVTDTTTMGRKGIYDPQTHLNLGMPIWEYLDRMRGLFEASGRPQLGGHTIRVQPETKNGKTQFKVLTPYAQGAAAVGGNPDPVGYMSLCFSVDDGSNLVSLELADIQGNVGQRVDWDYTRLGDVLVPLEMRRRNYTTSGEIQYDAKYVFRNQKINHVLDAGTFTHKSIGLLDGDVVVDKIGNKKFRYEAATQALKAISE